MLAATYILNTISRPSRIKRAKVASSFRGKVHRTVLTVRVGVDAAVSVRAAGVDAGQASAPAKSSSSSTSSDEKESECADRVDPSRASFVGFHSQCLQRQPLGRSVAAWYRTPRSNRGRSAMRPANLERFQAIQKQRRLEGSREDNLETNQS